MRTPTFSTLALLGLTAALAAAPVALAETSATETVSTEPTTTEPSEPGYPPPSPFIHITGDGRPQPGDDIGVVVGCPFAPREAHSPVLDIGAYEQVETPSGINTYVAPATIDPKTVPGDYPVTAWCGRGQHLKWTFTVYPADASDDGDEATAPSGSGGAEPRQVTRIPKGAPETGGGPESVEPAWFHPVAVSR